MLFFETLPVLYLVTLDTNKQWCIQVIVLFSLKCFLAIDVSRRNAHPSVVRESIPPVSWNLISCER